MCTNRERADQARSLIGQLLSYNVNYHNHKEIMAHAAVVLQIGLFVWIMSKDGSELIEKGCVLILFILIWLLIHLYMRWELRNRRWAAMQIDGIRRTLGRWNIQDIELEELQPYQEDPKYPHWFCRLCDLLIPCFRGTLPHDHAALDHPRGLVTNLEIARNDLSAGFRSVSLRVAEWIVTAASWLVLIVVFIRRF